MTTINSATANLGVVSVKMTVISELGNAVASLGKGGEEGRGGRLKREGLCVYTRLIHIVVNQQQKLTQHCKAITLH